jgi:uncharacterized protein (DUF4213/DUF364 family)
VIVEQLIDYTKREASKRKIKDMRVGIGYIAVLLDDNSCGLAFTFRNELGPICGVLEEAGEMVGKNCERIIDWAMDINLIKAGIGIAVINAICSKTADINLFKKIDAMQELNLNRKDTLGVIGYYKPVLEKKKDIASKIYIFERNITDDSLLYPDWSEDIYLPDCDVVIVTGTTLINKTVDHVLSLCSSAREIVLMGPTVPLCTDIFRDSGITLLAGSLVTDQKKILEVAGQGGGGLNLKGCVDQLCLRLNNRG